MALWGLIFRHFCCLSWDQIGLTHHGIPLFWLLNSGKNAFLSPSQLLSPSHYQAWLKYSIFAVKSILRISVYYFISLGLCQGGVGGGVGYLPSFKCFWLLYSRPCRYCVHAHVTIHNYLCLLASCACNFCTRITYMHLYSTQEHLYVRTS